MRKLTLDEMHKHHLQILEYFDSFCEEHHLTYWANFGTLLGAVRHKGFIPWDDDVDLTMPFEDYERLEDLFPHEGRFKLHSYKRDEDYYYPFMKVSDTTTLMKESVEQHHMKPLKEMGINIDVFPLYDYAPTEKEQKKQKAYKDMLIRQGYINHVYTDHDDRSFYKKAYWKVYFSLRKFESIADYLRELDKAMMSYGKSDKYISIWDDDILRKEWSDEIIDLPFEHMMVKAPKNWNATLTALFGDYMTPVVEDPEGHGDAFILQEFDEQQKQKEAK